MGEPRGLFQGQILCILLLPTGRIPLWLLQLNFFPPWSCSKETGYMLPRDLIQGTHLTLSLNWTCVKSFHLRVLGFGSEKF